MKSSRTQAERRADAKSSIVESAIELISTSGLSNLTLTQVAELSGYSRYIPIHYYGSKGKLVAEVVENLVRHFANHHEDENNLERGLPRIIDMVEFYVDVLIESKTRSSASHVITAAALTNGDIFDIVGPYTKQSIKFISDEIEYGIEIGNIRQNIDPMSSAVILLGFLRGITPLSLVNDGVSAGEAKQEMLSWINTSLSPDG